MKTNLLRNIAKGISLTSALFVFQACYGTPIDNKKDMLVEGHVKSNVTKEPIKGIQVTIVGSGQSETTDKDGKFSMYASVYNQQNIVFEDIDAQENGEYAYKSIVLVTDGNKANLEVFLDEK